ncbi:hypothetical protein [Calidifontibacillus oryziterrae]|uniref:hypothetical protein n=1 Tax=Calidifontibacillus oryziterrae TaxID=1191699 RepID=UPI0002F76C7F|nr:hypothetical protein [Calidifontibacillus oryziterrae]
MNLIKKMHQICEEKISGPILIDSTPMYDHFIEVANAERNWERYEVSYYYRVVFTNRPSIFFGIANEVDKKFEVTEYNSFKGSEIAQDIVSKVLKLFNNIDWRQQRDLILHIGKEIRELLLAFENGEQEVNCNLDDEDEELTELKITVKNDYIELYDVIFIEDLIELHTNKKISLI